MRTQQPPHASLRDVVPGDDGTGACFPGRGLCCPDDPLDLVLQLFPSHAAADRPPPSSLAALGIGVGGEPPRREQEQEQPQTLVESAFGGGGVWDSWGLSSFVLEGLCGLDEIDVDMFFADDALDGGEATQGNPLCDQTEAKPKPPAPAHITAGSGGPVHTRGSLGGAVVPNDASPLPAPMPAGAFPLQAHDACRASDAAVFNNASPPPAPMPAGVPPPVVVTNNISTPPLLALMPAAPAPMPAGGPPPVAVTNNSTPPLLALMPPAAPAPMPPAAAAAPMPAAYLHACGRALPGVVSSVAPAPPPLMAPMPAGALRPHYGALVLGVGNAPVHVPLSATPSPSSRTSSSTASETELPAARALQPHAWVVPTKQRSPPAVNRRKRPWLLDFPLRVLPPVTLPPPANPGGDRDYGNDDDDAKNRNAALLPLALAPPLGNSGGDYIIAAAGAGGGVRRRRPVPRQRNRQAQRVCSHCHSPETPQWRAGPDGPGTLCNACGIRYAANRLLPEYRPSTAPSFRSGQHSNRHRKVMKLREQQMKAKEMEPPSSEQAMEDDNGTAAMEKDDGAFMGVCEYISAAGL